MNVKYVTGIAYMFLQCVTARSPVAGNTCSAGIFYEYRVADSYRTQQYALFIFSVR